MASGINYSILNVDKKGRVQLPSDIRKNMKIEDSIIMETERNTLVLKPLKKIEEPLAFLSSINVKTKKTPVEMKREAELVFS